MHDHMMDYHKMHKAYYHCKKAYKIMKHMMKHHYHYCPPPHHHRYMYMESSSRPYMRSENPLGNPDI